MVAPLIEMLVAAAIGVNVPVEQLLVALGVASTSIPAGKESVTPTPVKATVFDAGLVIVIVKVETPFKVIEDGVKLFAICGVPVTVNVAVLLAAPAVVVCVVVTPDVVFGLIPATLLVTEKVTVQLLLAGIVIPLKLKAVAPADKLLGDVPVHVPPIAPATALILIRVSVNDAFVKADALLFDNVSVTTDVPPETIEVEPKALAIVGGAMTVKFAVAAVPGLLLAVVTVLVVFVFNPTLAPVTVTLKRQFVPAASVGLLNEMTFDVIEYEPSVQTVVAAVFAAVTPAGSVSVKASVLSARVVFGLVSVN